MGSNHYLWFCKTFFFNKQRGSCNSAVPRTQMWRTQLCNCTCMQCSTSVSGAGRQRKRESDAAAAALRCDTRGWACCASVGPTNHPPIRANGPNCHSVSRCNLCLANDNSLTLNLTALSLFENVCSIFSTDHFFRQALLLFLPLLSCAHDERRRNGRHGTAWQAMAAGTAPR